MNTREKFEQDCKEFEYHARMVIAYEDAFDSCINILLNFRLPKTFGMGTFMNLGQDSYMSELQKMGWDMPELSASGLEKVMLDHYASRQEYEACAALKRCMADEGMMRIELDTLRRLCKLVETIYTFSANCQVCWEFYDGHQEFGSCNTGIFSFDEKQRLSGTDIDGIAFVGKLSDHFYRIGKKTVCADLEVLKKQLQTERKFYAKNKV